MTETLDSLAVKIDALATAMGQRFDGLEGALVEQRQYTEFAYTQLQAEFRRRFDTVSADVSLVASSVQRVERKLDTFIETQTATNALVEERLRALEPPAADAGS